jgi:hypothetical protein
VFALMRRLIMSRRIRSIRSSVSISTCIANASIRAASRRAAAARGASKAFLSLKFSICRLCSSTSCLGQGHLFARVLSASGHVYLIVSFLFFVSFSFGFLFLIWTISAVLRPAGKQEWVTRIRKCEPGHCAAMSLSATGRSSQSGGRRLSVGRPAAPRVTKSTYTYKHRSPSGGSPTACP